MIDGVISGILKTISIQKTQILSVHNYFSKEHNWSDEVSNEFLYRVSVLFDTTEKALELYFKENRQIISAEFFGIVASHNHAVEQL